MKRLIEETLFITLGVILLVVGSVVGGAWWWYSSNTKPISSDTTKKEIVVPSGATFADVAQNLEEQQLIRNAFAFRVWTKLSGDEVTVQAGTHQFAPSMTYEEILHELALGLEDVKKIRFGEGWRVEEMDAALKQNLNQQYDSKRFLELARPRQGMLFPDTYEFQNNTTADEVITKLQNEFEEKYNALKGPTESEKKKRVIIIASMLEREGKSDQDRPVIAGIIENRLRSAGETAGFLQIDATVQYAVGSSSSWWKTPTPADQETDSPYNTYKYKGLPPAPICNPGQSSLSAAISPQENNYYYYIHDDSGKAYYARTLDEHNRNIAKYL